MGLSTPVKFASAGVGGGEVGGVVGGVGEFLAALMVKFLQHGVGGGGRHAARRCQMVLKSPN